MAHILPYRSSMNRHTLLGLCATLNVAQAWLDQAGPQYREATRHINHAVVEIHGAAGWSREELGRMGDVQGELVGQLVGACYSDG